jgi:hypothetical protein
MVDIQAYLILKSQTKTIKDISDQDTEVKSSQIYFYQRNEQNLFMNKGSGFIDFNATGIDPEHFIFIFHGDFNSDREFELLNISDRIVLKAVNNGGTTEFIFKTYYRNVNGVLRYQTAEFEFKPKAEDWIGFVVNGTQQAIYKNKKRVFQMSNAHPLKYRSDEIKRGKIAYQFKGLFSEASLYNGAANELVLLALMDQGSFEKTDEFSYQPSLTRDLLNHDLYELDLLRTFDISTVVPARFDLNADDAYSGARARDIRFQDSKFYYKTLFMPEADTEANGWKHWDLTDEVKYEDLYDISPPYNSQKHFLILNSANQDNICRLENRKIYFKRNDFIGKVGYYNAIFKYNEETLKPVWDNKAGYYVHHTQEYMDLKETIQISAVDYNNQLIGFLKCTEWPEEIHVNRVLKTIEAREDPYLYIGDTENADEFIAPHGYFDYLSDYLPETAEINVVGLEDMGLYHGLILNIVPLDTQGKKIIFPLKIYFNDTPRTEFIECSSDMYFTIPYLVGRQTDEIHPGENIRSGEFYFGEKDHGYYYATNKGIFGELPENLSNQFVISYPKQITIKVVFQSGDNEILLAQNQYRPPIESIHEQLDFEPKHQEETIEFLSV